MQPYITLPLGVPLGRRRFSWLEGQPALRQRIELVLSTPKGSLPWRPEFGCELWNLLGGPATQDRLVLIRMAVFSALGTWVPQVRVDAVDIQVEPNARTLPGAWQGRQAQPIERGLLHLGVTASLTLTIRISLQGTPLSLLLEV
jgi:phage baseplate assembly protein W